MHATDPSAAQVAQAPAIGNAVFAVEPGERCSLEDACVDAGASRRRCTGSICRLFAGSRARAEAGGVLVAWGYQDIDVVPPALEAANARLQDAIRAFGRARAR